MNSQFIVHKDRKYRIKQTPAGPKIAVWSGYTYGAWRITSDDIKGMVLELSKKFTSAKKIVEIPKDTR